MTENIRERVAKRGNDTALLEERRGDEVLQTTTPHRPSKVQCEHASSVAWKRPDRDSQAVIALPLKGVPLLAGVMTQD